MSGAALLPGATRRVAATPMSGAALLPGATRRVAATPLSGAALLPGAQADPVALGIGQHPETRRGRIADQRAARRHRRVDAGLHLGRVDPDVRVPALPRLLAARPLEPDQRQ